MKTTELIKYVYYFFILYLLYLCTGYYYLFLVAVLCAVCLSAYLSRFYKVMLRNEYLQYLNACEEDFFIVSEEPNDCTVLKRANLLKNDLQEAGNTKSTVFVFIYKEFRRNETWDEFQDRTNVEKDKIMTKRYDQKRKDKDFYQTVLKQV